jgi:hypothetical protein
LSSILEL